MQPGDRLIVAFVTEPNKKSFSSWPIHITLVPWFRVDMSSGELAKYLRAKYVNSRPFKVTALGKAMFGYKKRKTVNLVQSDELMKIEGQTRRALHAVKAWIVDEADKTRNFRPHVTVQGNEQLHEGTEFVCDKLYIVQQQGKFKTIEAEIEL